MDTQSVANMINQPPVKRCNSTTRCSVMLYGIDKKTLPKKEAEGIVLQKLKDNIKSGYVDSQCKNFVPESYRVFCSFFRRWDKRWGWNKNWITKDIGIGREPNSSELANPNFGIWTIYIDIDGTEDIVEGKTSYNDGWEKEYSYLKCSNSN